MNDTSLQQWSTALEELRNTRQSLVLARVRTADAGFSPKDFFETAFDSLDQILAKWVRLQRESLKNEDVSKINEPMMNAEIEALIEFEIEAIRQDLALVQSQQVPWPKSSIDEFEAKFFSSLPTLRKKHELNPVSVVPTNGHSETKSAIEMTASAPNVKLRKTYDSGKSGSGGQGLFFSFVIGLLLGGGPAVYFWDLSNGLGKKQQQEIEKVKTEKKELQDQMILIQTTFYDLAIGKAKNLPELEREIKLVRDGFAIRRRDLDEEFSDKRESILRKVSIDQLDQVLSRLDDEKSKRLESLNAQENEVLSPLIKQQQTLKQLLEK